MTKTQKQSTKKTKKKQPKRNKVKHPALNPSYSPKTRHDVIDMDYLNQLNPEDKEWMNQFIDEYVGASLDFKNLENNLHNTKELKKDCTDRNNARNRCLYTQAKINHMLDELGEQEQVSADMKHANANNIEDALIAYIDKKKKLKPLK